MRTRYFALAWAVATVAYGKTVVVYPVDGQAETTDGTGWTIDTGSTGLMAQRSSTSPLERRGVMEFDLSGVPYGATVNAAQFDYRVNAFGGAPGSPPFIEFRGYAGNGVAEAIDATRPATPIGTSPAINGLTSFATGWDILYLQSLVNAGSRHLGVYTYQATSGDQASFYSMEGSGGGVNAPRLTVQYTGPDVWVSGSDFNVRRYTQGGTLVDTVAVPYPAGEARPAADTFVRGTVVDRFGRLSVYNGATAPYVSTYDPAGGTWVHRTDAGLSSSPSTLSPYGQVAAFGSYLYASDMVAGTSVPQPNGVVRFSTADESVLRFGGGGDNYVGNADFLTRGQDGLLYVVGDGFTAGRIILKAFNPYSGALVRAVTLPFTVNSVAVGPTGEIYATRYGTGTVYDLSPAGAVVRSLGVGSNDVQGIDLWTDGTIVVGTRASGVKLTDTSLTSATTMVPYTTGVSTAFVSFAVPAPERGWKNDTVTVGTAPGWSDPANWNGPVPDAADGGADSIAVFGGAITGNRTLRLDAPRTVGTVVFDSAYSYRISNSGSTTNVLTMDVPAGQRALIDVVRGSHTLMTRVVLNADLTVHTGAGATVAFPPNFGAVPGQLNIGGHNVIWDYAAGDVSPAEAIRGDLKAGRGTTGAWTGPGIVSSVAAADGQKLTGIGWAEVSDLGITSFAGQAVDGSAVVLEVAAYGDANLDGVVDADDFARIDRGMAKGLAGWVNGDFDYDGAITSADYLLMDQVYAHQGGGLSPALVAAREARFGPAYVAELQAAVPEPGGAGVVLAVAAAGWVVRRRRR